MLALFSLTLRLSTLSRVDLRVPLQSPTSFLAFDLLMPCSDLSVSCMVLLDSIGRTGSKAVGDWLKTTWSSCGIVGVEGFFLEMSNSGSNKETD